MCMYVWVNLERSSGQLWTNFGTTSNELRANFMQTLAQFRTNFEPTSCKVCKHNFCSYHTPFTTPTASTLITTRTDLSFTVTHTDDPFTDPFASTTTHTNPASFDHVSQSFSTTLSPPTQTSDKIADFEAFNDFCAYNDTVANLQQQVKQLHASLFISNRSIFQTGKLEQLNHSVPPATPTILAIPAAPTILASPAAPTTLIRAMPAAFTIPSNPGRREIVPCSLYLLSPTPYFCRPYDFLLPGCM